MWMRFVTLLLAYAFVALFFGLVFNFPNRPESLAGFLAMTCALIPLVAVFDLLAQKVIDAKTLGNMRSLVAIAVFALFLFCGYQLMAFLALPATPW